MKPTEEQNQNSDRWTFAAWLISAILGAVVAFLSSGIVIPLIYGTQKRSSASVWGLSGVADFVVGFLSLPAFLVAHGIAFAVRDSQGTTTSWRTARSVLIGLGIFWVVIAIAWQHHGGGKVLRSH